jgi:hypothetical protein
LNAAMTEDNSGDTRTLAALPWKAIRVVGRIAKLLARDKTGKLLPVVKAQLDFWAGRA